MLLSAYIFPDGELILYKVYIVYMLLEPKDITLYIAWFTVWQKQGTYGEANFAA